MPNIKFALVALAVGALLVVACQSDMPNVTGEPVSGEPVIRVNQVGFAPDADKIAVVPAGDHDSFELVDVASNQSVFSGVLSQPAVWEHAGEEVRQADFSSFERPGRYVVRVPDLPDSPVFQIADSVYGELNDAVTKAFYFNRASTELKEAHAGIYARPFAHADTDVKVHSSAASDARPEGTIISGPKGWYDAGDYNKYIVNSGITTYTLMAAYEHFPAYYAQRNLNIPESGNDVPDLLDEIMWNLEWMLTMQDPNDGGVYHKLTTKNFTDRAMPHEVDDEQRYVVKKGTAAALNYAAVMATASRVYADYENAFPGFAEQALVAAEAAWEWAQENPDVIYRNPEDIQTGQYGDSDFADEFAWAAAELYITTGNDDYYDAANAPEADINVPNWATVWGLSWVSLAHHQERLTEAADQDLITQRVTEMAESLRQEWINSAYGVPMREEDFVWGSNGVSMNSAMMLLQGYRLTGERGYRDAAQAQLDYVLGRNPTGFSYVTGFGSKTPMHIHHRPSASDGIEEPIPGFVAGGAQAGQQDLDGCPVEYPSDQPAKSYLDHWCSYASNEIAINWNAPLVYVSGALEAINLGH